MVAVHACMGSEAPGAGTGPGNCQLHETWKSAGGQRVNERRREKGGKDGVRDVPFPIQTTDPVAPRALGCVCTGSSSNSTSCISIGKDFNGIS